MELLTDDLEIINTFMTRRRRNIIELLAETDELSQTELAEKAACVPSTLSSALKKFEEFDPKLIEMTTKGRFKMYRLTDVGRTYWETINNLAYHEVKMEDLGSDIKTIQDSLMSLLKEFKDRYNDRWEYVFDINLVQYELKESGLECKTLNGSEEEKDSGLTMITNFLEYLKSLLHISGKQAYEDFMNLNLINQILIERIKSILLCFVELQSLNHMTADDINCDVVYEAVDSMFGDSEYKSIYAKVGLTCNDYSKISSHMKKLAVEERGKSRKEIRGSLRKQFQISNDFAFILAERIERYIEGLNNMCIKDTNVEGIL